jgi:hypothetical protein
MPVKELLEKIKKELLARKNQIATEMVDGRMSDFTHYQKSVGVSEGLHLAAEILDEISKKIEKEEDD